MVYLKVNGFQFYVERCDDVSTRILVIEDELDIQIGLKQFLEEANYQVDTASDGLEGAYKANQISYDLILLDIMLPKMDGYAVLEMIRKTSAVPVMMLTAMGSEENQLKGFDLEADDYIVKPFTMNVVLRRVQALLRRSKGILLDEKEQVLTYGNITIDTGSCEVFILDQPLVLTSKEYDLLKLLVERPNHLFTRDELLQKLWGEAFAGDDYLVNVHIGNLRKKIGWSYIHTVRGMGYKLVDKNKE